MRRRVLLCLTLTVVSACQGDDATRPKLDPASSPSTLISDGSHSAGNPDFFFLPPLVRDPKTLPGGAANPLWNPGASNTALTPTVRICELAVTASSSGTVGTLPDANTACKAGGYDVTTTLTAANVSRGILDDTDIDNAITRFLTHYSSFVEPYYHFGWRVPAGPVGTTRPPAFYRIVVTVGSKPPLGILDLESVNNFTQLFNVKTNEFVPVTGSLRVPINFRIERYALCATPGVGPCTSGSGDIAVAPLTVSSGTPDASGISTAVGVTIPQQTGSTTSTPVTVTISSCPNLNPAVIDLPTFGDCVRVTTDPVLPRLTTPATVFICAVGVNASLFTGLSESQEARVTLHRYDASGPNAGVSALPHTSACTPGTPGGVLASAGPSLRGMLADVAHGQIKRAASQVIALLAPKPLYAAMFIDLGGGGFTEFFSDFQFALPAKMEKMEGVDGQIVPPGTTLAPAVRVTDLGGEPVKGAVVHFGTSDPATSAGTLVTTGADGVATSPWTIVEGDNVLPVSGRGIASPSVNGPRRSVGAEIDDINDPFQPIQGHFDPGFGGTPSEVVLRTGSVTFNASGGGLCTNGSSTDCNPEGTTINPAASFVDRSPPIGFKQCAGFINTPADDVRWDWENNCAGYSAGPLFVRVFDDATGAILAGARLHTGVPLYWAPTTGFNYSADSYEGEGLLDNVPSSNGLPGGVSLAWHTSDASYCACGRPGGGAGTCNDIFAANGANTKILYVGGNSSNDNYEAVWGVAPAPAKNSCALSSEIVRLRVAIYAATSPISLRTASPLSIPIEIDLNACSKEPPMIGGATKPRVQCE